MQSPIKIEQIIACPRCSGNAPSPISKALFILKVQDYLVIFFENFISVSDRCTGAFLGVRQIFILKCKLRPSLVRNRKKDTIP
jgi:hypothetical protein